MKTVESFNLSDNMELKVEIITSLYAAMISIAQEIRGTVERTTFWGSGLILALDGWLATKTVPLDTTAKVTLSLGIAILGCITLCITRTLQRRYEGVASVIRKINELQMAHEPGAYLQEESLMPTHWKNYGTSKWNEPIFRLAYVSLPLVTVFGIVVVVVLGRQ